MLYRFKSNLFVPGHKMHNLEDVQRTDVNALIIDLEDGCPDDLKKEAREDLINNFKDLIRLQRLLPRLHLKTI